MAQDCIFCRIVDNEIPSRTVYENEGAVAFLDANPLAAGHTLVVPKEHYETIEDLPEAVATHIFSAIHHLVPAIERGVDADGCNIGFNNGEVAGQEIPHVHGHVIPRFEGDGGKPIHAVAGSRPDLSDDELDDIAERVR